MKDLRERSNRLPIISSKLPRDQRKAALQESVNTYLEAIETQIGDLKKVGKNALVIGGVIVAAYALTELLLPEPKRKRENLALPISEREDDDDSGGESIIWAALKGAATTLLLTIAKEKLMDIIEHFTNEDAKADS